MNQPSLLKPAFVSLALLAVAAFGGDPGKPANPVRATDRGGSVGGPMAPVNPKVEPGKVRWHADFAAACAASKKSGKPVFLFQMMGKLDEQFC